jgi:GLPGLI family protein
MPLLSTSGQNPVFITEGKVEYERKLNLYAQMKEYNDDDSWTDLMKKSMPQFKTSYFELVFGPDKTLYKPGKENPDNNKIWQQPAEDNVIYNDIAGEKTVSQKRIFEQTFLIQDSIRKIKWKITDETRTIAGFQCRRANAMIMDSIYVVAFYTDEIITPGGPESFTGLPGMILGIALPHQHITWFATKVQVIATKPADFVAPTKGKKLNYVALKESLNESLKEWGKYGRRYIQAAML